jgi:hypothetical protein
MQDKKQQPKPKKEMVPGEMTGKMMPLKERTAIANAFAKELSAVKKSMTSQAPTKVVAGKEKVNAKMAKPFKEMVLKKIAEKKMYKK